MDPFSKFLTVRKPSAAVALGVHCGENSVGDMHGIPEKVTTVKTGGGWNV
jgi:hypothetical protein